MRGQSAPLIPGLPVRGPLLPGGVVGCGTLRRHPIAGRVFIAGSTTKPRHQSANPMPHGVGGVVAQAPIGEADRTFGTRAKVLMCGALMTTHALITGHRIRVHSRRVIAGQNQEHVSVPRPFGPLDEGRSTYRKPISRRPAPTDGVGSVPIVFDNSS